MVLTLKVFQPLPLRFKSLPRCSVSFQLSLLGFLENLSMFSMFVTCLCLLVICIFSSTDLRNFQIILMESLQNSRVGGRIIQRMLRIAGKEKWRIRTRSQQGQFPILSLIRIPWSPCALSPIEGQLYSLGPGCFLLGWYILSEPLPPAQWGLLPGIFLSLKCSSI